MIDKSRYHESLRGQRGQAHMTNGPAIVIKGTYEDWPDGPRKLTALEPDLEPNRQTFWFGAELASAGNQVWTPR